MVQVMYIFDGDPANMKRKISSKQLYASNHSRTKSVQEKRTKHTFKEKKMPSQVQDLLKLYSLSEERPSAFMFKSVVDESELLFNCVEVWCTSNFFCLKLSRCQLINNIS